MARLAGRLPVAGALIVIGVAGIALAARSGAAPALAAALALGFALTLVWRMQPRTGDALSVSEAFDGVLVVLPGALVVYFAFNSGGYFPDSPAVAGVLLVVLLVLRATLVDEPFAAFGRPLAIAAIALGLLTSWTLLSGVWSDAPGRALVEYDRALAYLLLLALFGSLVRSSNRLRWLAAGLAGGVLVVATAALATRLFPGEFPLSIPTIGAATLTYPVTYANALGILCALGLVLAFFFATSLRQDLWLRVVASASIPVLAVTIYFTDSRGAMIGTAIGLVSYVALGRPRGLLTGVLAAGPPALLALASARSNELLRSPDPTTAAAADQGHELAAVLLGCAVAAALLRLFVAPLDARLAEFRLPAERRRSVLIGSSTAAVVVALAVGLALDAPGELADQYDRFVQSADAGPRQEVEEGFFDVSNRGLLDNWRVGLEAFGDAPFSGHGAGTYETIWFERRPPEQSANPVVDGHSLYIEMLSELGVVGFVLLVIVVGSILVGLLPINRGKDRTLYSALFAVALAWAAHAAVDWDWEMPVVTAPIFALGGAALANHRHDASSRRPRQGVRVAVGLLLLAAAVAPVLVFSSQHQLNDARDALRAGNCDRAIDRATASIETLEVRAEPYEVLALCQARSGRTGLAIDAMRRAVERDPDYWRYHYGLAILRGGIGVNPRPDLVRARRLNPQDAELKALLAELRPGEAANWGLELLGPGGATGGVR